MKEVDALEPAVEPQTYGAALITALCQTVHTNREDSDVSVLHYILIVSKCYNCCA